VLQLVAQSQGKGGSSTETKLGSRGTGRPYRGQRDEIGHLKSTGEVSGGQGNREKEQNTEESKSEMSTYVRRVRACSSLHAMFHFKAYSGVDIA
jgi:hypothetical protein